MADFLLELFSEEIPARMQREAGEKLSRALSEKLQEAKLAFTEAKAFVTPRRVAVKIDGLPAAQPDVTMERKGPKLDAPEAAIQGFLKSTGLTLAQLERRDLGKEQCYFAVVYQKGRPTAEVLKDIVEQILRDFTWPKSMRWGNHEMRWVRPLHRIVCLLDAEVIPVTFGHITASNVTEGHRFMAPGAIALAHPKDYEAALEKAFVIADAEERKRLIWQKAEEAARTESLSVKRDDGLLEEVTGLVEYPVVLLGRIDAKYMALPPEVLVSEMRQHQKYFALLDKDGAMPDRFLITANRTTQDGGKAVIAGNERVLRARLADGEFFWEQDRKKPLSDWAKGLSDVTFHAKLGTIAQKVERITNLAKNIAQTAYRDNTALVDNVARAAQLCKADLVTGMVGEFPELQGVMGRYYALAQNEAPEVADAIRDHYKPLGPGDQAPTAPVSVCVALADKLDTLTGMFAAGEKPTGSKDPFALRRAALGVIRIILENNLRLPLDSGISAFVLDRLKVSLRDQGFRHDIVSAAIPTENAGNLVSIVAKVKALDELLATANGESLLAAYRRAANILRIEEKKDGREYKAVDNTLFEVEEEKILSTELAKARKDVHEAVTNERYVEAMESLALLRTPIDRFFDRVMVNCDNENLRRTRLGLLSAIREVMDMVADFSVIEDGEKRKEAA